MAREASKENTSKISQKSTKEFSNFSNFTDPGMCLNVEEFSHLSINIFVKSKISIDWDNIYTSTQIKNPNSKDNQKQFQGDFTDSGICLNAGEFTQFSNSI